MQESNSNEKPKPSSSPLSTARQKHRPTALPLNKPLLKMQEVAAELLSPGLDEKKLNQDQQKVFKQSKLIQLQQKQLIANSLYDANPALGNESNKRKSNTIIIEQVSHPEAKKINSDALSPLPNAKRFKRNKAPTPLKLSDNSKNIVPSIQTAPIKNNQSSLYKNKDDFINNLRTVNHNKQPFKTQPLVQQQQSNMQILATAQAAAAAVAQSPLNSAFFAPRYLPNLSVVPPVMTPSVYSQFYQSMMNNAAAAQAAASSGTPTTASSTTPTVSRQQNHTVPPASATATAFQFQKQAAALQQAAAFQQAMFQQQLIAAQTAAQAATQAALATGTPIASSIAQAASSPLTAFGSSFPITPLSYGFKPLRALPTTTSSQNYVVSHRETTINTNNNSEDSAKSIDADKKQDNNLSKVSDSEKPSTADIEVADITAPRSVTNGLKTGKTPLALNKRNLSIANPPEIESNTLKLRKSLQSPVGANIIKQTIVSSLGSNSDKEPKTPINMKKTNTPHVTDVFPNEMTKFAPLANQPLSAREERFDFAMYKDDSSRTTEKSSNREKFKTGKSNDEGDDEDDDDDVESKAIE